MKPEERRLKRGLKDISSIFESPENVVVSQHDKKSFFVKTVAVLNPGNFSDTFFLNSYMAAITAAQECPSAVLSIGDPKHGEPRHEAGRVLKQHATVPQFSMRWEEFESLGDRPIPKHYSGSQQRQMIFLNADYSQFFRITKLSEVIDKCILVLSPSIESLMEGYRFIKIAGQLNKKMQFYLVFDGLVKDELGCFLFENYSTILSRHLGISLVWLGHLNPLQAFEGENDAMDLEPLFLNDMPGVENPSKIALTEYVASHLYQITAQAAS